MTFDGKRARPVPSSKILEFITQTVDAKYLYDEKILPDFLNTYYEWIKSSKLNNLQGLEKFNNLSFVHGTSQSFDFFYAANKDRRMRCFKGDFIYHKIAWNSFYPGWEYIEDDYIKKGDAVIISLPFSDYGAEHPMTQEVLNQCDELGVPVFIDCAYYSIGKNINFNLDRPCIEGVSFSLSKAFYGAERLRVGLRCKRKYDDDPADLITDFQMMAKIAAGVGLELCNNFEPDYNHNTYGKLQDKICRDLNIKPSDCVIFGLADKNHELFSDYSRGTDWRRVCVSSKIAQLENI
jgi:hypothetical protein